MANNISYILLFLYLLIINLVTFLAFLIDKGRAVKGKWRIPEKTLLFLSLLGGAIGGYFAMQIARHKTRKKRFYITLPILIVLQILIVIFLCFGINNL